METVKILGSSQKQWESPFSQQGDCLIKKCGTKGVFEVEHKTIPKDAKKIPGGLVLKGQSNSHALFGGKFQLYEHNGVIFIDVTKATVLDHVKDEKTQIHAEHHAQWIPVGEYFVDAVQERDHVKEESRAVID